MGYYDEIDREMTNELYRSSVWICPLCKATRPIEDWKNFTSQRPPIKPCRLCGCGLQHGIMNDDGNVGLWFPREDQELFEE